MFDEKLFYKLCDRYGVEVREGKGKPMIYENGIPREIDNQDVYNIVNSYQAYFLYGHEITTVNIESLDYGQDEWAIAC